MEGSTQAEGERLMDDEWAAVDAEMQAEAAKLTDGRLRHAWDAPEEPLPCCAPGGMGGWARRPRDYESEDCPVLVFGREYDGIVAGQGALVYEAQRERLVERLQLLVGRVKTMKEVVAKIDGAGARGWMCCEMKRVFDKLRKEKGWLSAGEPAMVIEVPVPVNWFIWTVDPLPKYKLNESESRLVKAVTLGNWLDYAGRWSEKVEKEMGALVQGIDGWDGE